MTIKDQETTAEELLKAQEQPIEYTQEELERRKQELTLMSDRLTEMVFADNKCDTFFDNLTTQGKQST